MLALWEYFWDLPDWAGVQPQVLSSTDAVSVKATNTS